MNYDRTADLNPPLGRPGGPCHIVRRIDDEVKSPRLKEVLINKIEEGESLSNPEAAKVYDLDVEKARGFVKRLYMGPHSQYRMDLRGVTVRDVKDAIEELGKLYHAASKAGNLQKLQPFEAFRKGEKLEYVTSRGLKVVLVAEGEGARLVTTFWKGRPDPVAPIQCETRRAYDYDRRQKS